MAPGHVPAWKKLGLKLKNAEETTSSLGLSSKAATGIATPNNKRKEFAIREGVSLSNKKPKKIIFDADGNGNGGVGQSDEIARAKTTQEHTPIQNQKRKSVSFSTETKAEDGGKEPDELLVESASRVASKASPTASGQAKKDLIGEVPLDVADLAQVKKSKKKKKKNKSKSTSLTSQPKKKSSSPSTEDPNYVPAYLQYLTTHHTSRSSWKFNKAKQSQIIKRSLDIDKIPPSYDEALRTYIMALEGEHATQRLHNQAEYVIKEDNKALEVERAKQTSQKEPESQKKSKKRRASPEAEDADLETPRAIQMREQYEAALLRARKQIHAGELAREEFELIEDPAWRKRFFRRKRAEQLFWATDRKITAAELVPKPGRIEVHASRAQQVPDEAPKFNGTIRNNRAMKGAAMNGSEPKAAPQTGGGEVKRRRKRKRRSGIPDDDTSSDESGIAPSSSDEDSDDGEKASEIALLKALGHGKAAAMMSGANGTQDEEDETSSSGDSDSDSDSESSSSSDDD